MDQPDLFSHIYHEHAPGIYRFLYKMSGNAALSEELTQECFFQAWRCFSRYNGSCDLFTWLAAIAKNLYFSQMRKSKRIVLSGDLLPTQQEQEESEEDPTRPEDRVLEKERADEVRAAIGRLPKNYRDVVLLRIYAELKFSQIAAYLGISENSAKVLFYRAKNKLKEELSHVCL